MRYVIFSSFGNDSIATIEWAHERGLKDVMVAYSDTGWAASWWQERVTKAVEWVRSLGFQTTIILSEGMPDLVRRKKAWPRGGGGTFQFCTHALKEAPALKWLDAVDPDKEATCIVGVRREESANRATFPEHVEESTRHGGRDLWAPLVRHTAADRDELLARTPFPPLPFRSKECYPCVNANKQELRHLDAGTIAKVQALEIEMGTNSKGNERVMFSPARHRGAIGIVEVVEDAKHASDDLFQTVACDSGWCGD